MPVNNQVSEIFIWSSNVDCKSTAKWAETSALPAVQQYTNQVVMIGSSSAVSMISISHLIFKFITIYQLILSLDICCGQLILLPELDYTSNFGIYNYIQTGSFLSFQLIKDGNVYDDGIVKQDILQLLFCIQYTDTTVGYEICFCFGTSTITLYRTAQHHYYIHFLCLLIEYILFYLEFVMINIFQEISKYKYGYNNVKQNTLQLLFYFQNTDTTVGYRVRIYFGTSTINLSSTAHCYYYFIYFLCLLSVYFSFFFCLFLYLFPLFIVNC